MRNRDGCREAEAVCRHEQRPLHFVYETYTFSIDNKKVRYLSLSPETLNMLTSI